jgi:hypothetical protein
LQPSRLYLLQRDVYTNADGSKVFILHRNYGADGQEYDDSMATHPQYAGKQIADKTGKETPQHRLERVSFMRILMKMMHDMGLSSFDAYLAGSEALNAHLLCSYREE